MIRVFLLDDHALVRTGFRMILQGEADIEVVGEAENGEDALVAIRKLDPDVLLCDLHLPGISGLEVTERLARRGERPRVIMLSIQTEGPLPRRVLEAGAQGYLGKACPAAELLRAIREVARGRRYLGGELAQRLALSRLEGDGSPFDELSPRELEVAMMLVRGQRPGEIAELLKLSPKTVATHKYRLFDKLGISDSVALLRLASQYGLVDPSN